MREETRAVLSDLVSFPTVSTDPNIEMIHYLAERMEDAGARVDIQRTESGSKANLFATLGPEADGGLILSGHTDVVPVADQEWTRYPFYLDEEDGLLYGRGTCDMKGFIAACVAQATDFDAARLRAPIHFAFTHDEETGCFGALNLVNLLRDKPYAPAMAIVGEPTEMRVIEGHKGCCEYTTRFTGLEGHGSGPDLGVNAAEYAARYVHRILEVKEALKLRTPPGSRFEPPWTTMNVGRIEAGTAHNIIAGRAEVDWEMRPVCPEDADYVRETLKEYCDRDLLPQMRAVHPEASIVTEVIGEVEGLIPMEPNAARALVSELTGANHSDLVAFGTEAGIFQSLDMSVVVCGPGSIEQAHKPDEFVSIEQMDQCETMLGKLAARMNAC